MTIQEFCPPDNLQLKKRVINQYCNKHWTTNKIAQYYGVPHFTVWEFLVSCGVKIRNGDTPEKPLPTPTEIKERSAVVREGWDEATEKSRAGISTEKMSIPTADIQKFSRRKHASHD